MTAVAPSKPRVDLRHAPVRPGRAVPKVWLLTNRPSPYQVELFQALHETEQIDLDVRFMRISTEGNGHFGFSSVELNSPAPRSWRDELRLHPRALREALFGGYDTYILSGSYTSVTFLLCGVILSVRRKPWAVWLERPRASRFPTMRRPRLAIDAMQKAKKRVLRWMLRRATRVIGIGTEATRAYRDLGATDDKLFMLPYCCETGRFRTASAEQRQAIREKYRLDGKTVFLFSGQMIERKGVDVLLAAFRTLATSEADAALLLLGSGPQIDAFRQSVPVDLRSRVHFTGFLPQSALPAHFAAADVFVFPSRHDGWAVVVNEACAAGLPVIVSRQTGAASDLVCEGENGFVLDCEDVDGFCERMRFFLRNPSEIRRFGERSRALVQPFSAANGAWTMLEYVQQISEAHRA